MPKHKSDSQEFRLFLNREYKGHATAIIYETKRCVTHKLLAVLLSCAGAEQLHVEKSKNSK